MKKDKILLVLVSILIIGGVMGVMKVFIPGMEYFDYRYIITRTSTYEQIEKPLYAVFYSVVMAILELSCIVLFFFYNKTTIKYVFIILLINSIGCIVAIVIGDGFAVVSLLLRFIFLWYIYKMYSRFNIEK